MTWVWSITLLGTPIWEQLLVSAVWLNEPLGHFLLSHVFSLVWLLILVLLKTQNSKLKFRALLSHSVISDNGTLHVLPTGTLIAKVFLQDGNQLPTPQLLFEKLELFVTEVILTKSLTNVSCSGAHHNFVSLNF